MAAFARSHDPNDATFYVLRYPTDFGEGGEESDPFQAESYPFLSPELFHDAERHVTELRPTAPRGENRPPPGIAVEPGGDVFQVNRNGQLIQRLCDGTEAPFPCEPDLLRQPSGMALDRRGWLYIADPGAQRVMVLDIRTGAAVNVLSAGEEPVDVVVAASGLVFVADRTGRIFRYSPTLRALGSFEPRNGSTLPTEPEPIAVMIDAMGRVLVADARHPRLLRFNREGAPLADIEFSAATMERTSASMASDVLQALYGPRRPVFLATPGCDCPTSDGAARLTAVHLAIRLARLSPGRAFHTLGLFVSRRLDGGAPGVQWHKIVVDADLPAGTALTIETVTSDRSEAVPSSWDAPRDATGLPIPFSDEVPDQLVQSEPGRFLWLRMALSSDGKATPSVRAIRVFYPRNSPLELLPAHWQREAGSRRFLQQFLALVERVNTGVETTFEAFIRDLHPDAVPSELVEWLGALIDLSFDPSWPLERRRALLAAAMELYRLRGTPEGIRRYVEIYTGRTPVVLESFLERPGRSPYLGVPGLVLGCNVHLCVSAPDRTPDAELYSRYAHRFSVVVPLPDPCDIEVMQAVVDRIVAVNKPGHSAHTVEIVQADARVGLQARVGIDLVIGARTGSGLSIAGEATTDPSGGSVLGNDSVLDGRGGGFIGRNFGTTGGEL